MNLSKKEICTRHLRRFVFALSMVLGGLYVSAPAVLGTGNELSISPEQPANPDEWYLRSLADHSDVLYSQFKGKVVFLHFWATWCGPCLEEMPTLERLYQKLQGKDVVVLIVANQNPHVLEPYLSQHHFSFPMYTCGIPPEVFNWHSLPTTFVINPEGKVVHRYSDPYPFDEDPFINELLSLRKGQ